MNDTFWLGKKVLITGHTGFKGSWLTLYLQTLGAQVVGYSLPAPTQPSLFNLIGLEQDVHSYFKDIRDYPALLQAINEEKPDLVFHLAAQPLVRYSYEQPRETYETNVMGTVNLLEAVRQTGHTRAIVVITSDKCYENKEWLWGYRESDPMGGYDPYSSSKGCAELVTAAYRRSYSAQPSASTYIASARAGNVIGGGDFANDRLIPDFFRAANTTKTITIRNPNSVRPWQHVLEPLFGYTLLAEALWKKGQPFADSWNFGPDDSDAKPVTWILKRLTALWHEKIAIKLNNQNNFHEAGTLRLDTSKARQQLCWQPKWTLATALEHIVEWYGAFIKNQDLRQLTLQQIAAYKKAQTQEQISTNFEEVNG